MLKDDLPIRLQGLRFFLILLLLLQALKIGDLKLELLKGMYGDDNKGMPQGAAKTVVIVVKIKASNT